MQQMWKPGQAEAAETHPGVEQYTVLARYYKCYSDDILIKASLGAVLAYV